MTSSIWLAAVGDATDPVTFSGTPYHCLQAGLAQGVFAGGLKLETRGRHWQYRRALWNAGQLLTSGRYGGYQYSQSFLELLWRSAQLHQDDVSLLNFFQLYPETIMRRPKTHRWFYIDQTLDQLFHYYGFANIVPTAIRKTVIALEKEQYSAAEGVICHCRWAAASVINSYGIDPAKVHVVVCGANIDLQTVSKWEQAVATTPPAKDGMRDALRLVFVGKEWQRKGLDRLTRAMKIAQERKAAVELVVLGLNPAKLPRELTAVPGITWAGFIDKRREPERFIDLVTGCDVGCLLSRAEAGGISLREFARLGTSNHCSRHRRQP